MKLMYYFFIASFFLSLQSIFSMEMEFELEQIKRKKHEFGLPQGTPLEITPDDPDLAKKKAKKAHLKEMTAFIIDSYGAPPEIKKYLKQNLIQMQETKKGKKQYNFLKQLLRYYESEQTKELNPETYIAAFRIVGPKLLTAKNEYFTDLQKQIFETNSFTENITSSAFILPLLSIIGTFVIALPAILQKTNVTA